MSLGGVDQVNSRIHNCIATSLRSSFLPPFHDIDEDVDLKIVSDMHDYGAEHIVTIGNSSASYSTRVLFNLQYQKPRLMRQKSRPANEDHLMDIVHNQCIAFPFFIYWLATKNESITVEQISTLNVNTTRSPGPHVAVFIVNGKQISSKSTKLRHNCNREKASR